MWAEPSPFVFFSKTKVAHDNIHTVGLTNDTMRDHRRYMPSERHFLRWRRGHMVQYVFEWGPEGSRPWNLKWDGGESAEDVELTPPTVRLISGAAFDEVQRSGDTWHLPVRARQEKRERCRGGFSVGQFWSRGFERGSRCNRAQPGVMITTVYRTMDRMLSAELVDSPSSLPLFFSFSR